MLVGRLSLKPGYQLLPTPDGGVLLWRAPLRALRCNAAAFQLLQQCQEGFLIRPESSPPAPVCRFLDTLWQAKLLAWQPRVAADLPQISIIVPVFNRVQGIADCLQALLALAYPADKREIIVVDDGSQDGTPDQVRHYPVKLLALERNRGQAAARNIGAAAAQGEILAFIDSDCIADPQWLRELVPYFQDERVVLVGGYVAAYYQHSWLDRFEEVQSPLNMGREMILGVGASSDFYVPTCNVLIRKEAYRRVGGLNEQLRVGEDVDLCWRLKAQGHHLLYVPKGKVRHQHRDRFWQAFRRRFDYGTSEAFLFTKHRGVRKKFPWKPAEAVLALLWALLLLTGAWQLVVGVAAVWLGHAWQQRRLLQNKIGVALPWRLLLMATLKEELAWLFFGSYHLQRYYLVPLCLFIFLWPHAGVLVAVLVLLPLTLEYLRRRPRLPFVVYGTFFLAEQISYQMGVFWGCVKAWSFSPYHLNFIRNQAE
ncbi:MAG: mycofactocin biosynthesis glycosyltransferase MftF [Desulfobacca sp.]|uniref:mycofactocin biosynthesis glycosyltransferase MftF n=1 Tax=Desulfobacca sp. TaxID=2067990 RepID=UPI00404A3D97